MPASEKWWDENTTAVVTGGQCRPQASSPWHQDSQTIIELGVTWHKADSRLCNGAANKGIGYEIARQLAAQGLKTIVTARNGKLLASLTVSMPPLVESASSYTLSSHANPSGMHIPEACCHNLEHGSLDVYLSDAPAAELGKEAADKIAKSTGDLTSPSNGAKYCSEIIRSKQ